MDKANLRSLEDGLNLLLEESKKAPFICIQDVLKILSGKGRALVIMFLSLPFCQPLQIPGLSTPFGIVIGFIGLRIAFGKHFWLPKRVLKKNVSSETIQKIAHKGIKIMKKLRPFIHPRLGFFCNHPVMKIINGILIFFLGIFLALPLPIPLTNITAAWAIFLTGVGLLEDDGVFLLIGYLGGLAILGFFIGIIFSFENLFNLRKGLPES